MKIGQALVLTAAIIVSVMAVASLVWKETRPFKGYPEASVTVVIEPRQPARVAAAKLAESGVVRSPLAFRLLMRLRRAEEKIHAGEYEFSGPMTPDAVLDKLVRGDIVLHKLTIPEGLRIDEIADL